MLMLNDLLEFLRSIKKLHILCHIDHIINRLLLVHILEVKFPSCTHLLKHIVLHPRISYHLCVPEHSCYHLLVILKTLLSECDINTESRYAVQFMILICVKSECVALTHQV